MDNIKKSASKILGMLIFISGSAFAFLNKDPKVLIESFMIAAALIGTKTAINGIEKIKGKQ